MEYAKNYFKLLKEEKVKLIVIYNDPKAKLADFQGKIVQFNDFMKEGERVDKKYV
jgi:hypothetical protein